MRRRYCPCGARIAEDDNPCPFCGKERETKPSMFTTPTFFQEKDPVKLLTVIEDYIDKGPFDDSHITKSFPMIPFVEIIGNDMGLGCEITKDLISKTTSNSPIMYYKMLQAQKDKEIEKLKEEMRGEIIKELGIPKSILNMRTGPAKKEKRRPTERTRRIIRPGMKKEE